MPTHFAASTLERWTANLPSSVLRGLESAQSATRPDGRRLRAVEVAPGLYLARDHRFYATSPASPLVAELLTPAAVLARCSFISIQREIAAQLRAKSAGIQRRIDARARHAQRSA